MKGIVFVELIHMAESAAGEDVVDDILDSTPLPSGGAYTAVGNYPCAELMMLVQAFSDRLGAPVDDLQMQFGAWMFDRLIQSYPNFLEDKFDAFTMLESIDAEVHVEVRKLYPEVELPSFDTRRLGNDTLEMRYRSERPLIAFCHGMIAACVDHFQSDAEITRHKVVSEGARNACDFRIRMAA